MKALLARREDRLAAQEAASLQRKAAAADKAAETRRGAAEAQRRAAARAAALAAPVAARAAATAAHASTLARGCADAAREAEEARRERRSAAVRLQCVARSRAARAERRRRVAEADERRRLTISCKDGQVVVNERQLEYFLGSGLALPPQAAGTPIPRAVRVWLDTEVREGYGAKVPCLHEPCPPLSPPPLTAPLLPGPPAAVRRRVRGCGAGDGGGLGGCAGRRDRGAGGSPRKGAWVVPLKRLARTEQFPESPNSVSGTPLRTSNAFALHGAKAGAAKAHIRRIRKKLDALREPHVAGAAARAGAGAASKAWGRELPAARPIPPAVRWCQADCVPSCEPVASSHLSVSLCPPARQATTATTATLRAMLAHLATPTPPSPLLASSSSSSSAASAASAPRESKSESKAKARRLARAFGQIPPEWTELERIDDRIEVYSHEHAVVFQNDHTTVLLGPVLAVPRDACPDAAPDILYSKPHLASPRRLYDRSIPVAVKRTIKPSGAAQLQRALREKNVLMRLSHPHIVQARQAALLPAKPPWMFRLRSAMACDAFSMTHA